MWKGLLATSRPRGEGAGQPQRSPGSSKKEPGPRTLMVAEGWATERSLRLARAKAPSYLDSPVFLPRGCASLQVTQGLGLLCWPGNQ